MFFNISTHTSTLYPVVVYIPTIWTWNWAVQEGLVQGSIWGPKFSKESRSRYSLGPKNVVQFCYYKGTVEIHLRGDEALGCKVPSSLDAEISVRVRQDWSIK
jgi:hypothetical protein